MSNQKYDQVVDLLAAQRLNWVSDDIIGVLVTAATFDASHTTVSQLGSVSSTAPIPDRSVQNGNECWGSPAVFANVQGPNTYQMVLAQNDGSGDPKLLAWYDTDDGSNPLTAASDGTLIIRPSLPGPADTLARIWMQY